MGSRATVIAVGAIIAIPLIFAALGAGQDAGLAFGVVLVVVGVAWMLLGSRAGGGDRDPD
jgi:type III secretory pathway component EscS